MNFKDSYKNSTVLMEGALGERLKREFNIYPDATIALAGHVYNNEARLALQSMWMGYYSIAQKYDMPFMATTPTRRANKERIADSKFSDTIIDDNVAFLRSFCADNMFIGALIGCKGDAYKASDVLLEDEAQQFHTWTIERFARNNIDFFYAGIMPALSEASGMAKALSEVGIPYIISFMIRDNGCLIDGTTIHDAISYIDSITVNRPLCYMTNCVHPAILYQSLSYNFNNTAAVKSRFCGIQANTSSLTPEKLDNSQELQLSDPKDLADNIIRLKELMELKIVGGCCGTNNDYMEEIAQNL